MPKEKTYNQQDLDIANFKKDIEYIKLELQHITEQLEKNYTDPDLAGWMVTFKRWFSSAILRGQWAYLNDNYGGEGGCRVLISTGRGAEHDRYENNPLH